MNSLKYILMVLMSLNIVGCTDYEKLKVDLQMEYDQLNPDGNRAVCYFVGDVQFPYSEEPHLESDIQYDQWKKNRLFRNLPLFAELGLLSREQVSSEPLLYRYQLTELGRPYQYTIKRLGSLDGTYIYENYFCYGKRVLLKVTDVSDQTVDRNSGKYVETTVEYDFKLENVPEWAKSPELAKIYKLLPDTLFGDKVPGSARMKKENGQYYNDGWVKNYYFR
ncbi:hypothetical protein [Orbus mooreae]|uniref:hypothetical protein n=1 Tax=Orbus mooreae TaxID=3074107 RepID=UPI00370D5E8C